jgi:hypothetical protein
MKRFFVGVTMVGVAALLGGCPIYSQRGDGPGYGEYQVCNANGCFSCPDPTYSSACFTWHCSSDDQCGGGNVCSPSGSCVPPSPSGGSGGTCSTPSQCAGGYTCGQDGACHPGDCGTAGVGCPGGYVCKLADGQAQCVAAPSADAGEGAESGGAVDAEVPDAWEPDSAADVVGSADVPSAEDAGPADAGPGWTDVASGVDASGTAGPDAGQSGPPPRPCNADAECGGGGAKCVDGHCRAQVGLCSDATQCVAAGAACVDGLCEPRCSAANFCPTGFSCDLTRGVCNVNPSPCTSTSGCQGGTVCVEAHCVPPCSASGSACPAEQQCVNGGCLPIQSPAAFACTNDGHAGAVANTCSLTSICIHHDCYATCAFDAGVCVAPNVCKMVTTETGTYAICGLPQQLGSECDPAQGRYCSAGEVCVDGYCR